MTHYPPHVPHYPRERPYHHPSSVTKITMPVVMVALLLSFVIGVTVVATWQFSALKFTIEGMSDKVDRVVNDLAGRIDGIERELKERTSHRWSKKDHEYWCSRTEQINTDIVFKCAENPGERRIEKTNSWRAR